MTALRARSRATAFGWTTVDRARSAQPVYAAALPTGEGWFWSFALLRGTVLAVACLGLVAVVPEGRLPITAALVVASFGVAGVRKGQRIYMSIRANAQFAAALVGALPEPVYWESTSSTTLADLVVLPVAAVPVAVVTGRVAPVALITLALCLGRVLTEAVAHVAVIADGVTVAQYGFLLLGAGCAAGVLVSMTQVRDAAAGLPDPRYTLSAGGALLVLAPSGLWALSGLTCRARWSGWALLPTWRGARLPLAVRLWTVSNRRTTSLTVGLTVLCTVLVCQYRRSVVLLLPAQPGYVRAELSIAVLYLVCYALSLVFREPLDVQGLRSRRATLRLLGVAEHREALSLWPATVIPVVACAVPVAVLVAPSSAMRDYPATFVAAVLTAAMCAACAAFLGAAMGGTGAVAEAAPFTLISTAFPALLVALLATGHQATSRPDRLWDVLLAAMLGLVALLIHIGAFRRVRA